MPADGLLKTANREGWRAAGLVPHVIHLSGTSGTREITEIHLLDEANDRERSRSVG